MVPPRSVCFEIRGALHLDFQLRLLTHGPDLGDGVPSSIWCPGVRHFQGLIGLVCVNPRSALQSDQDTRYYVLTNAIVQLSKYRLSPYVCLSTNQSLVIIRLR